MANTKAKSKKSKCKESKLSFIKYLLPIVVALVAGAGVTVIINNQGQVEVHKESTSSLLVESDETIPALMDDMGEYSEDIPTVEEVDGGLFKDIDTGLSSNDEYNDLGWAETYNVSSPEAFRNDTYGKCIIANNYYGAQCVSLARVFWWSYADRDVSTCGTGMAKGMMNCASENAGDDFLIFGKEDMHNIQTGDWLIFNGGMYGHVGMALGGYNQGYVALLGENQGGRACEGGGAATNIINISLKNLIGYYRPKAYVKPEPKPEPTPEPTPETKETYTVKKGDTLGSIARKLGWYTGKELFGDKGYAQQLADYNGIKNRGLIYPGQVIKRK